MGILWAVLSAYLLFTTTYIFYCAIIIIGSVWEDLHPVIKVLVGPFAVLGYVLDIVVNVTIGTILFLEFPHELLFTHRLKRWREETGYRRTMAIWLCERGLNPIQPNHC